MFDKIVREYSAFLDQVGIRPAAFIPVSGRGGDNIADRSAQLPWYDGPTVLDALDQFHTEPAPVEPPFRMPVQDVYKFTKQGDDRRIVTGTIDSGAMQVGDAVIFYPSGKKSRVKSIEAFNRPVQHRAEAGWAVGFTLQEQIYITRGEVATLESEPRPQVTTRLRVSLFWLGRDPMIKRKEYLLKLGTARVTARIEEVLRVMDASTLDTAEQRTAVQRHDVAECILKLDRAIACDLADRRAGHQPVRHRGRLRDSRRRHRARGAAGSAGRRSATGCCSAITSGSPASSSRSIGRRNTTRRPRSSW